ncbi:S-layer homology domain-containing protein [Paenibacillus sp. RC67]|uniref:S-layer homology domain-containing protein n=1 Tax=Paenibacillus sp. RC67 TaxID=3039392 RepID=UPI0024AD36C5|nr:S-layer homology domain-containing protein [Paenibacillus sp. RC67]
MIVRKHHFFALQKKHILLSVLVGSSIGLFSNTQALAGSMVLDSFDGPVTQNEIDSFKAYIQTVEPVVWGPNTSNMQSEYAQGTSGENIKALGLMYEITGDTEILDRMIYFVDVLLSQRNDILPAPYGQKTVWTNTIAPVWPGTSTDGIASADSANGDSIGHMAYCARLILQTPWILDTMVPNGDKYGHGKTYRERAATFVKEADYVVSEFLFPSLLDLSRDNKYYFSTQSPYMSGGIMPWNQQMMMSYGLQNLAAAHEISGDNASLVARYDDIVQTNLDWFFNDDTAKKTDTSKKGNPIYNWGYNPTLLGGEDSNHASLDVAGFYRAHLISRYGITEEMLKPFANMYADVMMRGPNDFAGRVDGTDGTGHGAPTTSARNGNLFLAALRPDMYDALANSVMTSKSSTSMATFSRLVWAKNKLSNNSDTQAPTSPTNLKATAASSSQINLSWTASTDNVIVRAYNIYRNGTLVGTSTTTSYSDKGLTAETAYSYTVKAKDAAGNISEASSTVIETTWDIHRRDTEAPTAPTHLKGTAISNSQINLSWTASTDNVGVTGYDVYRGLTKVATVTTTTYSDTGLQGGTTYDYYIKAKDLEGNVSPASNAISVTTLVNLALGKPSNAYFASSQWNATYTASKAFDGTTISSRWSSAKGLTKDQFLGVNFGAPTKYNQVVIKEVSFPRITSYKLQYSNDDITYMDIEEMTGTTIGANRTLIFAPVTSQYFRLFMMSTSSNEPSIDEMEVYYITGGTAPSAAPTGLTATAGDGKVALTWNTVTGATYYNVKRSTAANGTYTTVGLQLNTNSFSDGSALNGTTYYYTVTAGNIRGESAVAGPVNAAPKAPIKAPTAAPTGLIATAGDGKVALTWDTVAGATYFYNVSRSTAINGEYKEIGFELDTNSYVDSSVQNGTTYYYKVTAGNEAGESPATESVSATPMAAIQVPGAAPTGLTATAGDGKVALTWNTVTGATYYNVKRSVTVNGTFTTVGDRLGTSSYTDAVVQNGTTYNYKVTAGNEAGEGPVTEFVSATPMAAIQVPGAAPTGLTAAAGDGKVALTWNTVTGATYYNVKRSATLNGTHIIVGDRLGTSSYTDAVVQNGTTYYYKVTAGNEAGEGPATESVSATPMASITISPVLTLGSTVIQEALANDGSIAATQVVTLTNGTFIENLSSGVTVNNLPAGLGISVTRNTYTQLTISFTGKAMNHASANNAANASVTVDQAHIVGATGPVTSGMFSFAFADPESGGRRGGYSSASGPAAAPNKADVDVTIQKGAELVIKDVVKLLVPAGAVPADGKIFVAIVAADQVPAVGTLRALSQVLEFTSTTGNTFSKPLEITFQYDGTQISKGNKAAIYYYNEREKRWVYLGGTVNGDGTITVKVNHFTKFAVYEYQPVLFSDLTGHWVAPFTDRLIGMKVIQGYSDQTFHPEETITRAQFAKMMTEALGLQGVNGSTRFADDNEIPSWAKEAVNAAMKAGLIQGYEENGKSLFKANQTITRAEMSTIIANALKSYAVKAGKETVHFKDASSIPAWAQPSVDFAASLSILNGYEDGTFRPSGVATRAEAASMIFKLLEPLNI